MVNDVSMNMGCSKSSTMRDVYSNKHLHFKKKEKKQCQIKNLTLYFKELKEKKINCKLAEEMKIRAEINGLETKKTREKVKENNSRFFFFFF